MGSIDKAGVYDKNDIIILKTPRIASGYHIAGISSSLLERSLSPAFILISDTISDDWMETDAFATIDIDVENNSLIKNEMF